MQPTVAASYLARLTELGFDSIFVNAGTDFAPIVEAYAVNKQEGGPTFPKPVLCAHENLAAGMAHGAALVTHRPQALMVHVSVGTANALCAVANASRDKVPLLVTAGRSPILESDAVGSRDLPIHWTQEMFDQASIVREFTKWDYELRDARQVTDVVDRAVSVAQSQPQGPVYLSLPREVLGEPAVEFVPDQPQVQVPEQVQPDPEAVEALAARIAKAKFPIIVSTASGQQQGAAELLGEVCEKYAIAVADPFSRFLIVSSEHPNHIGTNAGNIFAQADLIVFLESDVPWIEYHAAPRDETFIAQVGVDPLHSTIPMRTHRSDLNIQASPVAFLSRLDEALEQRAGSIPKVRTQRIRKAAQANRKAVEAMRAKETADVSDAPITKPTVSAILGELLEPEDLVFNEYVGVPDLLKRTEPDSYFFLPSAGGLGWGLPAALGAKYVSPDRTVVALLGDGAYMFANPAACHHASAKHDLPVLTVLCNDSEWWAVDSATRLVYPDGVAAGTNEDRFSDLRPSPEFAAYCEASGGHGITVHHRSELRAALEEGLRVVREEGRQALVDVRCI